MFGMSVCMEVWENNTLGHSKFKYAKLHTECIQFVFYAEYDTVKCVTDHIYVKGA